MPKENFLYLLTPTSPSETTEGDTSNGDPDMGDDEDADFVLQITDESQNRDYSLNFRREFILNLILSFKPSPNCNGSGTIQILRNQDFDLFGPHPPCN